MSNPTHCHPWSRVTLAAATTLHLQKFLLPASAVRYSLHRALVSTAAVGASPVHFAAEDYLVTTCGLTKEQATKAAKHIAHCKSPYKADEVLSFLATPVLGLSKNDIMHIVSQDAGILNCSVEKTLRPRVDALLSHGLTAAQIRTFLREAPLVFRRLNVDEQLGFWLPFLGSLEKFLRIVKHNIYIVTSDLQVKLNIQLLRESGLSDGEIANLCMRSPRLLTSKTDNVRATLARAEELGIPRNSSMFKHAVATMSCIGPEAMAAKLKFIGEILGCSDDEVAKAVKMAPNLLVCSREKLHSVSEFLTKVVGIDSKYILRRPTILTFSLERRIAPRHYVMKVLLEKGLLRRKEQFYSLVVATDKAFQSRYIARHKDVLPGLADAYASACNGKLPT